jgi:protein arginine N-methyltransferase 7
MSISKDEEIHLHAVHTETSISYNLKTQAPRTEVMQYSFNSGDLQLILSPERIAIYGDSEWRDSMLKSMRNAVRYLSRSDMHVLIHKPLLILILFVHIFYFF